MRVLIVLALIGAACAVSRQSTRIVGGETTTIENYPFMVRLIYDSLTPFCGGTLITSTSVVSAAHCHLNDPPSLWKARLGSSLESSGGNVHAISRFIFHPLFTITMLLNDITIVKLTNPAVFSNQIKIARIAGPKYILADNTVVHAVGWGNTEIEGNSSEVLQHAAVNIINHEICTERYAHLKTLPDMLDIPNVTPKMLCTGILDVGGKAACQGDDGGPIIHNRDVLVGIVSWAHECADPTYPGVNTRVSSYTNWIYTNSLN